MGLIKAGLAAASGVLADTWKEFFYCDAMDADVLVKRGQKKTGKHSSNKGNDNVITNGSGIAVADGQCMLIVDQGKVAEVCAEPGEYTYDKSSEPSIFTGKLGDSIKATFEAIGRRFTYGGDTGKDQRVYYINTKELIGNKFGTPNPVPFRVVDSRIGLDVDVSVRCNGTYSYKIADPVLFYSNVCGNVTGEYTRDEIDSQLKTEFISALQPAFAKLSALEIRPNQMVAHTMEMEEAMNAALSKKWSELRGLKVVSVALGSITLPPEDQEMIKKLQKTAVFRDPTMTGANLTEAQADAMRAAASNAGGAVNGFMGFGMASNAGNAMNAQSFYSMGQKIPAGNAGKEGAAAEADSWTCKKCGTVNTGKFCTNCGDKKPEDDKSWTCPKCGTVNTGKFCKECGTKKPAANPAYRCSKCGYEPEDPHHPPKFCPECGKAFGNEDIVS